MASFTASLSSPSIDASSTPSTLTADEPPWINSIDASSSTTMYPLPNGRWGHSMITFTDGAILVFGGLSNYYRNNTTAAQLNDDDDDDNEEDAAVPHAKMDPISPPTTVPSTENSSSDPLRNLLDIWLYDPTTNLWSPVLYLDGIFPSYITNRIWGHTCTPLKTTVQSPTDTANLSNTKKNKDGTKNIYQFLIVGGRIGAKPCTCEIIYLCTIHQRDTLLPSSTSASTTTTTTTTTTIVDYPSNRIPSTEPTISWMIRFDPIQTVGLPPKKRYNHSIAELTQTNLPSFLLNDPTAIHTNHYLVFGGHGGRRRYFNDVQILRFEYVTGSIPSDKTNNNNDNGKTFCTSSIVPRAVWELVTIPTGTIPSRRAGHTMTPIHSSSLYILIGGFDGGCILSDIFIFNSQLWQWGSVKWECIAPSMMNTTVDHVSSFHQFPSLVGHSAVSITDQENNYLVVYGGASTIETFNDSLFLLDMTKRKIYTFSISASVFRTKNTEDKATPTEPTKERTSLSVPSARCWQRMVPVPVNIMDTNAKKDNDTVFFIFGGCNTEAVALHEPWSVSSRTILDGLRSFLSLSSPIPDSDTDNYMDNSIRKLVKLEPGYSMVKAIAPSLLQVGIGGFGVAANSTTTTTTGFVPVIPVTNRNKKNNPLPYEGLYKGSVSKIDTNHHHHSSMGMVMTNITSLPIPSEPPAYMEENATTMKNTPGTFTGINTNTGISSTNHGMNTDTLLPYPGIRTTKTERLISSSSSNTVKNSFSSSSESSKSSSPRILVGPGGAPTITTINDTDSIDPSTVHSYSFPYPNRYGNSHYSNRNSPRHGRYNTYSNGGNYSYNQRNTHNPLYGSRYHDSSQYAYDHHNKPRTKYNSSSSYRSNSSNDFPSNDSYNHVSPLSVTHDPNSFDTRSYGSLPTQNYSPSYGHPRSQYSSNESIGNFSVYPKGVSPVHGSTGVTAPIMAAQHGDAITYYSSNDGGISWYPVSFVNPTPFSGIPNATTTSTNTHSSSTTSPSMPVPQASESTNPGGNSTPAVTENNSGNVRTAQSTNDPNKSVSFSNVPPSSAMVPYPPPSPGTVTDPTYNAIMIAAATASMVVQQYHYMHTMNNTIQNTVSSASSPSISSTHAVTPSMVPMTPPVYYSTLPMVPTYSYPFNYSVPPMYSPSFYPVPNEPYTSGTSTVRGNNEDNSATVSTTSLPDKETKGK